MHHRDAGVERIPRGMELHPLAEERDLALIGPVEPREDVRQRGLTGAVLAQQRVDFAGRRLEVDVLVRDDGGEPLGDAPERDRRRWRGGVSLPAPTISPWRYRSRL
jgi:hypothetical protein